MICDNMRFIEVLYALCSDCMLVLRRQVFVVLVPDVANCPGVVGGINKLINYR